MSSIVYGRGGYRPAHPSLGKVEEFDDAAGRYTKWNDAGTILEARPYTPAETAQAAAGALERAKTTNRRTIEDRAAQALTANATYLALGTPTNAQVAAQVRRLTQECSALIRLALNQVDSTDGTA
jgi:hypothetical protein